MKDYIIPIIIFIISIVMFIISFRSFKERGFLFNNAYIYASKEERDNMNKKPHYRQSAIVFLMLGILFLIISIGSIFDVEWLFYVEIVCMVITAVYAVVSSILIFKKQ